ncbi:unnamed protein product [Ambrosiozyma monospora]|uniref:Unnamed protein product n=1 Tax=Ambrosiozyma monospora TaxID=43982 RepID=A0A9W6Z8X4_AMBMO|nr:unnamed protein product [Ambrosiozyma monospora]
MSCASGKVRDSFRNSSFSNYRSVPEHSNTTSRRQQQLALTCITELNEQRLQTSGTVAVFKVLDQMDSAINAETLDSSKPSVANSWILGARGR